MSIKIKRSDLTEEQKKYIRKHLFILPELEQFGNSTIRPDPDPIQLYRVTQEYIYIPFSFGNAITKTINNQTNDFPLRNYESRVELFDHQREIVDKALGDLDEVSATNINVFTGCGKTAMCIHISCIKKLITVIFVTREILLTQWKNSYEEFTTAKCTIVELGKKPLDLDSDVYLCMDTRYAKFPDQLKPLVGMVVFDESHTFCTKEKVDAILTFQPKYVIGLSATPNRNDGLHRMMNAVTGLRTITKISTKPMVVIKYMTGYKPHVEKNQHGTDWSKLLTDICSDQMRNELIVDLVKKMSERKILLLTERAEHVRILLGMLIEAGIKVDSLFGKKKSYSDSQCLIGTVSKIGTGMDEKTACPDFNGIRINTVFICTSIKSLPRLEQAVGRGLRCPDTPLIIHLVDNNPTIKSHWTKCSKWYLSRQGQIIEKGIGLKKSRMKGQKLECDGQVSEVMIMMDEN